MLPPLGGMTGMVVGGDGSSLASQYMCLILVLGFPVRHVLPLSIPTELQTSIPLPESATICSFCGLYGFQFHNTEAATFLPQAASFFGAKV